MLVTADHPHEEIELLLFHLRYSSKCIRPSISKNCRRITGFVALVHLQRSDLIQTNFERVTCEDYWQLLWKKCRQLSEYVMKGVNVLLKCLLKVEGKRKQSQQTSFLKSDSLFPNAASPFQSPLPYYSILEKFILERTKRRDSRLIRYSDILGVGQVG
jgi:hypothetical protein